MQKPNGLVTSPIACTATDETMPHQKSESRETAIESHRALLKKLKAELHREEAQLILLKKLRASQRYNSASAAKPPAVPCQKHAPPNQSSLPARTGFTQMRPCRNKATPCVNSAARGLPNANHMNNCSTKVVKQESPGAASHHPSFILHQQQALDAFPSSSMHSPNTAADRQWTAPQGRHQVSNFGQSSRLSNAFTGHTHNHNHGDPAQRQAIKRQNLRKSIDKFLFSVRSYRNRLSDSFLSTAPINFLPSPISHDFTMMLGLEEICRFFQQRMHHHRTAEEKRDQRTNRCALCGSHCSPMFFRLRKSDSAAVVHCSACLRSLRFRQLECEQLARLQQIQADTKLSPREEVRPKQHDPGELPAYCPLSSEQLRLCQAQWMRQARLLSPGSNGPFSGAHFLSPAVAAAAAIAAMTATHHPSGIHMPFQPPSHIPPVLPDSGEEQAVALNLAVKPSDVQHRPAKTLVKAQLVDADEEMLSSSHFHK